MTEEQEGAADRAYRIVRSKAVTFAFTPSQRINEVKLSRDLAISRTPLREALNRLASEGFIMRSNERGFSARTLDPKDVFDLYELRLVVELAIVEIACERASDAEIATLIAYAEASSDCHEDEDVAAVRYLKLDEGFHERIAAMTDNAELIRLLAQINGKIHFVRWLDMRDRRQITQSEHLAIAHAISRRDAESAQQLIREHVKRRREQIVEVIRAGYGEIYTGNRLIEFA